MDSHLLLISMYTLKLSKALPFICFLVQQPCDLLHPPVPCSSAFKATRLTCKQLPLLSGISNVPRIATNNPETALCILISSSVQFYLTLHNSVTFITSAASARISDPFLFLQILKHRC